MAIQDNKVAVLAKLREAQGKFNDQEKLLLQQGFASSFWKLLEDKLLETLNTCTLELEQAESVDRIRQLQGEIAALRVLTDWGAAHRIMKKTNPF